MNKPSIARSLALVVTLLAATAAAQERPEPQELEGTNSSGTRVVFSPNPWRVCEAGVGTGWIYYLKGNEITEVWPHQRCSFEEGEVGKLQFSCVSDDGPRYSFSQAVYVLESRSEDGCSYVCKSGCSPHAPQILRTKTMVPVMPPMPPPPRGQ